MIAAVGGVLVAVGAVLLVIAAWGVIVLPDALARQHAATKAGTLALTLVCTSAMIVAADPAWTGCCCWYWASCSRSCRSRRTCWRAPRCARPR